MYRLIDNLSDVTLIPKEDISKLSNVQSDIICDYAVQQLLKKDNRVDVDVGIGTLSILFDGEVKYKFIGNEDFDNKLKETYKTKKSPLKLRAEKAIYKRLKLCYKELL